jgi:tetraacyldisaccharide 4'-kinase
LKNILLAIPALVFWSITAFRNFLFDKKVLKRVRFELPLIGIGNLNMGGTGKSPLVEWLLASFSKEFKMAVLSRGYGRRSSGFKVVQPHSNSLEAGDEPLLFKWKFPHVAVSVCEDRVVGVPLLLDEFPETQVVILDDVFQHRYVKPGLMILTTAFEHLFTRDKIFPLGGLRESKRNYHRADIIVVTKCPQFLTQNDAETIVKEICPFPYQRVYFTTLEYGRLNEINHQEADEAFDNVLLLTGIADSAPLLKYFEQLGKKVYEMKFADHHIFDNRHLEKLQEMKLNLPKNTIIVTTEKDAVRLAGFKDWFLKNRFRLYIQPVCHRFLFEGTEKFSHDIRTFIHQTLQKSTKQYGAPD